jgi:hypothetical protein
MNVEIGAEAALFPERNCRCNDSTETNKTKNIWNLRDANAKQQKKGRQQQGCLQNSEASMNGGQLQQGHH